MDIEDEKRRFKQFINNRFITSLSEGSLDHTRPVFRNSQISIFRYRGEYTESALIYLNTFFNDLRDSLLHGVSIPSTQDQPYHGYTFPDDDDIKLFAEANRHNVTNGEDISFNDAIANKSPNDIDRWLNEFFANIRKKSKKNDDYQSYVICAGKVGSGKTTFIKYLTLNHDYFFKKNNILPVVLYYKDWKLESDINYDTKEKWRNHIDNVILFNLYKTLSENEEVKAIVLDKKFKDFFIEEQLSHIFIEIDNSAPNIIVNQEELVKRAEIEYRIIINLVHNFGEMRFRKVKDSIKINLLNYLTKIGKTIFVIIDGLDQLSIGGINEGKYKYLFETLSSIALDSPHNEWETQIRYTFLFTFRMCTYSTFNEKCQSENYTPCKVYPIVPANIKRLLYHAIENITTISGNPAYDEYKPLICQYIFNLVDYLKREFDLTHDHELTALFNNNYRELLNFIIECNKYLCSKVLRGRVYNDLESLLTQLIDILTTSSFKKYEIFEILILRDKSTFQNYYDFARGTKHSFDSIMHKNTNRGFVDNLYNYTQNHYGAKIHPLLVNVRILQFLKRNGYSTETEITRFIESLGYICDISSTLKHYSGSGFIKIRTKNKEITEQNPNPTPQYIYGITGLGNFAIKTLVYTSYYIEYVVHHTLFPENICCDIHALYQDDIPEWIEWSLVNLFIFYNYVSYIEQTEKINLPNIDELLPDRKLAPKIKQSIIDSLSRVTPYETAPRCDLEKVNAIIENIINCWKLKRISGS